MTAVKKNLIQHVKNGVAREPFCSRIKSSIIKINYNKGLVDGGVCRVAKVAWRETTLKLDKREKYFPFAGRALYALTRKTLD